MTPIRSKTYTTLQKTYDQCFLTCNTAAYYESQGNEPEALRCWRECLAQIQYYNATHRNTGAFRSTKPKSETEKTLEQSLKTMELQCQERVDLLEALRISRLEAQGSAQVQPQTAPPPPQTAVHAPGHRDHGARLTRAPVSSQSMPTASRGLTRDAGIDAPPLPQRPQPSQPNSTPPRISHTPRSSLTPPPAMPHVVYPKLARTSSPEKRTSFLTTLRTKRPQKRAHTTAPEDPGAAAKAAGLAWGSISRTEGSELAKASTEHQSTGDPAPSVTARQVHSTSDLSNTLQMPDPKLYCPQPRPNGPAGPRPRPQSTIIQSHRSSTLPLPNVKTSMTPQGSTTSISDPSSNRDPAGDHVIHRSSDIEKRLSTMPQKPPPLPEKPKFFPTQGPLGNLDEMKLMAEAEPSSWIKRKPVPSTLTTENCRKRLSLSSQETSEGQATPTDEDAEDTEEELQAQAQTVDEERLWKERVKRALATLGKGVDSEAVSQIMNEIVIKGDEVHWDDVAGLEVAKMALKEAVVYPFLRPDLFRGLREPARGMLLFGPPGTGKTMIARAVATESKSTFFSISASSLTSKYLGESEKLVRALFALAKALAPSIIFVDEIDSLLSSRGSGEHEATRRLKTEFLIQWSNLQNAATGKEATSDAPSRVLVLAATNLPWAIDEAARRRFVRRQYIPLPEPETRRIQFQKLLSLQHHALSDEDLDRLVDLTEGFSGSDIAALAKDAAMGPLRSLGEALLSTSMDEIRPIALEDFERSLLSIRPSVSKAGLEEFEKWAQEFGERV